MKSKRTNTSWRQQTATSVRRIAGVFGLAGAERHKTRAAPATPAVPNLTYLEDSQFEEEAMLVEPGAAAAQAAGDLIPAPRVSAFAPKEGNRLSLPRLPGANAVRHDQEDHLEDTFRQRSEDIAAMIAKRDAPTGDTPARPPNSHPVAAPQGAPRAANRGKFPGFDLM